MSDTPPDFAPPNWDDLDDTRTIRRKTSDALGYLMSTQATLLRHHHERKGSERTIKALLSAALLVGVAAGGWLMVTLISAKGDIQVVSARVDDLAKQVERLVR